MKILQLDVNRIGFKLIAPEAKVYEQTDQKETSVDNAVVLLTSVEAEDSEEIASKAVKDALDFATKQKRTTLVFYPFAHLSGNLEAPQRAMKLFHYMVSEAKKSKLNVYSAPFGWNKALTLDVKGHPLAEMSRSYAKDIVTEEKTHLTLLPPKPKKVDLSIVRKSDFSGLPDADHRSIAEKLNLFSFQEVSPGMAYWHGDGYIVFKELVRFIREKLDEYGYEEIATPAFANVALWHVSGHIDHYRNNMFLLSSEGEEMALKPMNCPSTMLVFKSRKWSYRDLPVRLADFDKLYRNEISGALTGLFRVREITQDDAHLFVTDGQVQGELTAVLKLVGELYRKFNLPFTAKLSTMPDSHLGDEELWERATTALRNALEANHVPYTVKEKEGAFYGPKIDFDVMDSMKREWQCATVQLDYQLPQRFGLEYTGEDGKPHTPVVIHRVIYGSLERFIGILTEHYQGKFPTWLAPVQVKVLTISEQANQYAQEVYAKLRESKIRAELDVSDKTLDYKIREGQVKQVPYMLILGAKEVEQKKVAIRGRGNRQKLGVGLEHFIKSLQKEIEERDEGQNIFLSGAEPKEAPAAAKPTTTKARGKKAAEK